MSNKTPDNQLNKEDLLTYILDKVKELKLSAYQVAKFSDLSHVGIDKILVGKTKSPSIRTLEKIKDAINTYESQQNDPVTLITINEKLDYLIDFTSKLNDKIDAFVLDTEITLQILKNSSSPEELRGLEKKITKKS